MVSLDSLEDGIDRHIAMDARSAENVYEIMDTLRRVYAYSKKPHPLFTPRQPRWMYSLSSLRGPSGIAGRTDA